MNAIDESLTVEELQEEVVKLKKKIDKRRSEEWKLESEMEVLRTKLQKSKHKTKDLENDLDTIVNTIKSVEDLARRQAFIGKCYWGLCNNGNDRTCYRIIAMGADTTPYWCLTVREKDKPRIRLQCACVRVDYTYDKFDYSNRNIGLMLVDGQVYDDSCKSVPLVECTQEDFDKTYEEYVAQIDKLHSEAMAVSGANITE